MLRRFSGCLAVSVFCLSTTVVADGVAQLKALVDSGNYQKAYELALSQLEAFEGDPAFDLQYATAAIDTGHVSEGLFALERVLLLQPDNQLARLEQARGYYLLAQFERSRQLFLQVLGAEPPATVKLRIEQYLALIDQKTRVPSTQISGFVELYGGYDDNINTGPDDQTSVVTLSNEALGRGDAFSQLRFGVNLDHAYTPENSLFLGFSADARYYQSEPEQDYRNLSLTGGHLWKNGGQEYRLGAVLQTYNLDGDSYRDLAGINAGWSRVLGRDSVIRAFAGVHKLRYDELSWRDATQVNLGVNYLWAGRGDWRPIYFTGGFIGREIPEDSGVLADAEVDRLFYGGHLGVQLKPAERLTLTPALTYQASDYEGRDWIYGVRRKDDLAILNLNLEWGLENDWALLANYSYSYADSNIELYEYDRQQLMLGVRYKFK